MDDGKLCVGCPHLAGLRRQCQHTVAEILQVLVFAVARRDWERVEKAAGRMEALLAPHHIPKA